MKTPAQLTAEIDDLRDQVERLSQDLAAVVELLGNTLSANALVTDGNLTAQLRGLVSCERAGLEAHRLPIIAIQTGAGGMPFLNEHGLAAPLAVGYYIEDGIELMFPRAAK